MESHPDNSNLPTVNLPQTVLGVTITFLSIAIIAISLRLWVRLKDRLWGWDELFIVLAVISTSIGSILICLMPKIGLGKHFWTLDDQQVIEYYKSVWSTNTAYTVSTTMIKLSILFQYLRLFEMQSKAAQTLTKGMLILTFLWGTTFFLLAIFSCNPIAKNWNADIEGTCVAWGSKDPDTFFAWWVAHSASNMLMDILILTLPIPFLRRLRMGRRTRLGFIGLFTMGGVVATVSVARLITLSLKRAGTVPVFDPTYATPAVYMFSVLEVNIAILAASIPIFWPLVTSFAANKILVVNEIEIRTDRRTSQTMGFAEQGGGFSGIPDLDPDDKGRSSRMSALPNAKNDRLIRPNSRTTHSNPRLHRSNPSAASSTNPIGIGIELATRMSQESQRNLAHQPSKSSFSSSSPEHNVPMDAQRNGSTSHFQNNYAQDWDFNKSDRKAGAGGTSNAYTTTVERAEIPFDHIRALEK